MNLKNIFQEHTFSDAEKSFMEESHTATTADMNQSRIVSEFVFGRNLEKVADRIIDSNKKLADSNEEYSRKMVTLTKALVFVGIAQVIATAVQVFIQWK